MPQKAYKLRPEYEGSFVGGSVITGVDCGSMDIKEELDKHGQILTSDPTFQHNLENYYGMIAGTPVRILQVSVIDEQTGEATAHPLEGDPEHIIPQAQPPRPDLLIPATVIINEATGAVSEPVLVPNPPQTQTTPEISDGVSEPEVSTSGVHVMTLDGDLGAEHEDSGYSGLSDPELKDIITERGLSYPRNPSSAQLVSILEDHDKEEGKS